MEFGSDKIVIVLIQIFSSNLMLILINYDLISCKKQLVAIIMEEVINCLRVLSIILMQ